MAKKKKAEVKMVMNTAKNKAAGYQRNKAAEKEKLAKYAKDNNLTLTQAMIQLYEL